MGCGATGGADGLPRPGGGDHREGAEDLRLLFRVLEDEGQGR